MTKHASSAEVLMGATAAAKLLGVCRETLNRAADAGRVAVFRTPGGLRRYRLADIETFRDELSRPRSRGEVSSSKGVA